MAGECSQFFRIEITDIVYPLLKYHFRQTDENKTKYRRQNDKKSKYLGNNTLPLINTKPYTDNECLLYAYYRCEKNKITRT